MKQYHQLSQEERYIISTGRKSYDSLSALARAIGRSPSTVSRELKRNCGHTSQYYAASVAHLYSVARRGRERRGTHFTKDNWDLVISYLKKKWSPEHISERLRADGLLSISHETIYRYILRDKRNKGRLYLNLRHIPKRDESVTVQRIPEEYYQTSDTSQLDPQPWKLERSLVIGRAIP